MNKLVIKAGDKYGRLTIIREVESSGQYRAFYCKCDCGNNTTTLLSSLRTGKTASCGCLRIEVLKTHWQGFKKGKLHPYYGKHLSEETKLKLSKALTGKPGPRKGKKHTKETIEKMRKSHKGAIVSKEHREKLRKAMKGLRVGAKHPMWKGGITIEHTKIKNSFEYREWRRLVYERDRFTCLKCGVKAGKLIAHHIESFGDNPELRVEIENGATLCKNCHDNFHCTYGRGKNNRKQFEEFLNLLNYEHPRKL